MLKRSQITPPQVLMFIKLFLKRKQFASFKVKTKLLFVDFLLICRVDVGRQYAC